MQQSNPGNQSLLVDSKTLFESRLFHDVQCSGLFEDSKTFADAIPKTSLTDIFDSYETEKQREDFSLQEFVACHFDLPRPVVGQKTKAASSLYEHIEDMWGILTREPDSSEGNSTLLPLPHPYIVPGGRFGEIYYWDSYFTALGLIRADRLNMVIAMFKNFAHLMDVVGCVPNGNRTYYHSRSQPPIMALMAELIVEHLPEEEKRKFIEESLKPLTQEYQFWMDGSSQLNNQSGYRRVLKLSDGSILNRYWDDEATPRPESYLEDLELAHSLPEEKRPEFYRNIRAACESGWDFSSRWLKDQDELLSIQATDIIPVDLNGLLYKLESTLAKFHGIRGDTESESRYLDAANARKAAIQTHLWDEKEQFYYDLQFSNGQHTITKSLAAAMPLYVNIADDVQAQSVANTLQKAFLKKGGLITTTNYTTQQWDAPNGWAPLQWIAVKGLQRYQFDTLAKDIMQRWVDTVDSFYSENQCIMEKYNVERLEKAADGGEYEVQEGFGWTNGVTLEFIKQLAT